METCIAMSILLVAVRYPKRIRTHSAFIWVRWSSWLLILQNFFILFSCFALSVLYITMRHGEQIFVQCFIENSYTRKSGGSFASYHFHGCRCCRHRYLAIEKLRMQSAQAFGQIGSLDSLIRPSVRPFRPFVRSLSISVSLLTISGGLYLCLA